MKSYVLEKITRPDLASNLLSKILPGQTNPWLLVDPMGDAMAYVHIDMDYVNIEADPPDLAAPAIVVDISGRHYNSDKQVIALLEQFRAVVGGKITSDA